MTNAHDIPGRRSNRSCIWSILGLMKSLFTLAFMVVLAPMLASGQTVQTFTIDPYPTGNPAGSAGYAALEKTVGFFTSTTMPSVVVGMNGNRGEAGMYLYTSSSGNLSGPWVRTTIDPAGDFYERSAAFLYPGDTYPGIIASRSRQLVWYHNPMNWGGDPTQPWKFQIINPNAGCHDLRIADVDQDGLADIVCSATTLQNTRSFIAFQDDHDHWKIVNDPFRVGGSITAIMGGSSAQIGDGIDLVSISGGPRINVVGATNSGVYWFRNPKLTGGNPRSDPWPGSYVGDGNLGVSIATGSFNGSGEGIVVAPSELTPTSWASGLVWYEPPANPTQTWLSHSVDSTYRAVHQIDTGNFNGIPYIIVAEQEQACGTPGIAAEHLGIPCRVTLFQFKNGSFNPFSIYEQGTQNQSVISYDGGLLVVGGNHGYFGTLYPALQAWLIHAEVAEGSSFKLR
jgi:hypothetical protein